ncbi:MAG TPA: OpgC domain-containing protein [Acetobacteraceae bacterium]|nr:OpgC domain-containing protein [Acetobacteraceae bacterium]
MQLIRGGSGRDLRVDFFRGLALWWIFIDHTHGDLLGFYTLHEFAPCDAAEIFVLLAGFGAAKAYAGAMDRHGWRYGATDAVGRAWTLYIAHIFLFVTYAAQVSWFAAALHRPQDVTAIQLDPLQQSPFHALLQALTLRYQPSMLNILPLYIVLLLIFAIAMPVLRRPRLLLGLSVAMYLVAWAGQFNLPGWRGTGWYLDPFSWQLVFVVGAILGYAPPQLPRQPALLDVLAVVAIAWGVVVMIVMPPYEHQVPWLHSLVPMLQGSDKTTEAPARVVSMFAFLWLAIRLVPPEAPWLRSRAAALLELPGQHSLPVFCASILLAFVCSIGLRANSGAEMELAVNICGALCLLAVAGIAAWAGQPGRAQRPLRNTRDRVSATAPQTAGLQRAATPSLASGHNSLKAAR